MDNSRCQNLCKIQLTSATKYSMTSPCTNVLLQCPLCPKPSDCIWKYNMHAHILGRHPSANIDLYGYLFALVDDEYVLMKVIYLAKPCKSKNYAKESQPLQISEGHSSRLVMRSVATYLYA